MDTIEQDLAVIRAAQHWLAAEYSRAYLAKPGRERDRLLRELQLRNLQVDRELKRLTDEE